MFLDICCALARFVFFFFFSSFPPFVCQECNFVAILHSLCFMNPC